MPTLNLQNINSPELWQKSQVELPAYNVAAAHKQTLENPKWLHFGAGNIFRGYIAALADTLLASGEDSGIIAAETYDEEIIEKIYKPHSSLCLLVSLCANGSAPRRVIGSIADGVHISQQKRLEEYFKNPALQMVSFTITEKGYATKSTMNAVAKLLYARFLAGGAPLAMVSMDNCSHNGDVLKQAVLKEAEEFDDAAFIEYLNSSNVSFPWSMIDKITPRPEEGIAKNLEQDGIMGMQPIITAKGTYIAPFVNAEKAQYLVIEDNFPNGRPPLEKAGVYLTNRDTVNRAERMKVTTCLNPLHTALAIFGCLLEFEYIADEIKNPLLHKLVSTIGYTEGLPVVTHPGIFEPKDFLDEVMTERLPNPFLKDTPQRIATDTSQKLAIRFGETIKTYHANGSTEALRAIPLVLAGWLRYLNATTDAGKPMELSGDPRLEEVQKRLENDIDGLLADESIFGISLFEAGLAQRVKKLYTLMCAGNGAVKKTMEDELK